MCVIGLRGGTLGELDFAVLMQRRLTLSGSTLRNRSPEDKARIVEAVHRQAWPMIEQGQIKLVTDSVFALADAAQAHDRLAKSAHVGKILLRHRDAEA
jgi:NADPH:quinone reductase-like Zn-dependent oxidoreductase